MVSVNNLTATQTLHWIPPFCCTTTSALLLHHTLDPNDQQQQPKCWNSARADSESGVAKSRNHKLQSAIRIPPSNPQSAQPLARIV
eukprot:14678871-Alexandrium_andersonii.AAC.2